MTDIAPKYKIYPSSSGLMDGEDYEVEYNSSCLRYLVVAQGIHKSIPEDKQLLGAKHEDWWEEELKKKADLKYIKEHPIRKDFSDATVYSGRIDYLLDGEIHELKASESKNVLYSTIRKKEVKLSHLSQLISYMSFTEITKGKIIVGFYKTKKNEKVLDEYHIFEVEIDDEGKIIVDGKDSGKTVSDYIKFLYYQIKVLDRQIITKRPKRTNEWKDPCKFCPLKNLCKDFDYYSDISSEDFINQGKEILNDSTNAKI